MDYLYRARSNRAIYNLTASHAKMRCTIQSRTP
jgi:hypothetical protein